MVSRFIERHPVASGVVLVILWCLASGFAESFAR